MLVFFLLDMVYLLEYSVSLTYIETRRVESRHLLVKEKSFARYNMSLMSMDSLTC